MADDLLGNWTVAADGILHETEFPSHEPAKDELDHNHYALFVYYGGLFRKRIIRLNVSILNAVPRDSTAEARLREVIRKRLLERVTPELLKRSGGIEMLMGKLTWDEWWG